MVLYRVYSEPHRDKYYSTVCSKATLFQIVVYCIIIVPPFFIAYSTNDLWQYTSSYREQPDVHFLNQLIVQLCDGLANCKTWSSFTGLNQLLQPEEAAFPTVKSREDDADKDGVNDLLNLSVEFTDLDNQDITSVRALLFFDVRLSLFSSLVMHSLIYTSESWCVPSSRLQLRGELGIEQREPLPASGRVDQYNASLLNSSSVFAEAYDIFSILRTYSERNVTTVLRNVYPVWEPGLASGNFTLQVELRYPIQTITYAPGFWQLLKFAWIQYLAIFIVLWYILGLMQSFVFSNHVILTVKRKLH